jgi:hypothetical protein
MAYVNNLRATSAAPGSTTTRRTQTTRQRDPTQECNVCLASASSSSEPESAPCHRAADAQRRARLNELAEARRQLDEELALLHQELGVDPSPAIDNLHRISLCRSSPVRGMATGVSAVRLLCSRAAAHRHHRHVGRHVTTADAPTRVLTPMPTLMLRHSSGRRSRTLPR